MTPREPRAHAEPRDHMSTDPGAEVGRRPAGNLGMYRLLHGGQPAAPERSAPIEPLLADVAPAGNRAVAGLVRRLAGGSPPSGTGPSGGGSDGPPEGFLRTLGAGGSGQPLPADLQVEAEARFDADFGHVRLHTDAAAADAARQVNARAFTVGPDVFFAGGQYRPSEEAGRRVLAHELTHVLQDPAPRANGWVSDPADPAERAADAASDRFLAGGRVTVAGQPSGAGGAVAVRRTPDQAAGGAAGLIDRHTSWGNLDEDALGRRLFDLAWMGPDHYGLVVSVLDELGTTDRDDVSSAFVRAARDEHLDQFAQTDGGRAMLKRLRGELKGGLAVAPELGDAARVNNAVNRGEGAAEGAGLAQNQLAAAEAQARGAPVVVELTATLPAEELTNRTRLIEAVLARLLTDHPEDADVARAVAAVRQQLSAEHSQIATDPAGVSARIVVAQQVVERCQRNLELLRAQLAAYGAPSADQAKQPGYVEATQRVRARYVEALAGALTPAAAQNFVVAEAAAAALPRALTEIDLGIMAHRGAAFEMPPGAVLQMVAWIAWMRGRLPAVQTGAQEVAKARESGAPDLADRQARLVRDIELLQLSMEAVEHWERLLRGYEILVGGVNVIPSAYDRVDELLKRLSTMRAAAEGGDVDGLRVALGGYRTDPAVAEFYQKIPRYLAISAVLTGVAIMIVAAIATAGVGALVAVGEGASLAAVAGSVALETVTFTAVSYTLTGAVTTQQAPLLVELAMNAGLFGLLRGVGMGVRGALVARDLAALAGPAQHVAAYGVLEAWGTVHFRVAEGRWPSLSELAVMSAQNLLMYAALAGTSRAVTGMIASGRQLRALEAFNAKYGADLAKIEAERAQLATAIRTELAAGRGNDPAVIEPLRARAAELDTKLRTVIEAARGDATVGAEALRSALADVAQANAEMSGELLTRSFELPERVGLRRGGTGSQYTYEAGNTQVLVDRLRALGAQTTETVDGTGRRTVTGTVPGEQPMYFAERSTPADLQPQLAKLAEIIERPGATRAERGEVIGELRTPHGQQERGALEGFAMDSVVAENQRAMADLIQQLTKTQPDVIVGMERGGALVADVIAAARPDLAGKIRKMPAHTVPDSRKAKFDADPMQAQFEQLIQDGARKIALVDVYMGGRTAGSLRDQVFLPLARRHPGVTFETHWIRELMGLEQRAAGGGIVVQPRSGLTTPGQPGGSQVQSTESRVRMALGDDMQIAFDPRSTEPITIFDRTGRIVRVLHPKPGQTTRDVLIDLLSQPAPGP